MHTAIVIHRHVHAYQTPIGQDLGTFGAKAHWWLHVQQHFVHVFVMHTATATRIDLTPSSHVLVEMMSAQNGRVTCQVVEIVHDDGHEQVEHEKRAEKDEANEVSVGKVQTALFRVVQNGVLAFVRRICQYEKLVALFGFALSA